MAVPYDSSIIPSIYSLEEAHMGVKSKNFDDFLSAFESTTKIHKENDRYGITLVHRHTDVDAGHRIFDFKQTLQQFPLSDVADDLYGAAIRPKSYALRQTVWKPYEFELGACDSSAQGFFAAVKQLIQEYELVEYVGLRRYSPDDPEELEITERKGISLKIPWDYAKDEWSGQDYKTTFWAFPTGPPKTYKCACVSSGTGAITNHNHIEQK